MNTDQAAPRGLLEAFHAYETALMSNDLEALDKLFAPGADTLRGDAAGLLVGHEQISTFRSGRGGAPQRTLVDVHVRTIDTDHALVVAVTELVRGGRGQQTQLWVRNRREAYMDGWQVTAAHVSVPDAGMDRRIWRILGDPLVPAPRAQGPLAGESIAVKDLYAVAGQRIGAGNPAWLAEADPEAEHAAAVARLLAAGADIRGIARTDEFAYSLAGANAHYGTPPNPKAPHRGSGGSSSGSASAVGLGHATIGLGTDTGGSIRVPAAYQGLFGIRTTHGAVDRAGLLPLAPSFDTVGWMTRTASLLRSVGDVLLPPASTAARTLVAVPALLDLAEPDVARAVHDWLPRNTLLEDWPLEQLDGWLAAFQTVQAWEAWQVHGSWVRSHRETLGPDVGARFDHAATIAADDVMRARETVAAARSEIRELVGDRVLILPSTASVASHLTASASDLQATRQATMRLTCLAGIGGLPAVTVPHPTTPLPTGVCLVAAAGRDRDLLDLAVDLTERGEGR
ncbi:AtzH-like domain-containing protein [Rhodococcus sp. GA1]|uniref:AtzH-like domain-containing protein n=1 Tax=Rhodococcus sp. GA1 TaxID=2942275 RepID=UPI0020CE2D60|nr:AtzH-like domain-containing protein [Rhodococcus sp. GA1]